jgi:hypothetical protein
VKAAAWFYGSSFHSTPRTPSPAATPVAHVDTRPRVAYVLPDGTEVRIIHDHGQYAQATITYGLAGGRVVTAIRADLYETAVAK